MSIDNPKNRGKRVAVLMGGCSAERDISIITARECANALQQAGYKDVVQLDISRDLSRSLVRVRPDVCFNALHGPIGEDGSIQGFLNVSKIPYTHSGVVASSIAMHKEHAKRIARSAGIQCPQSIRICKDEFFARRFDRPYVLKPLNEGSSALTYLVRSPDERPFSSPSEWPYRVAPIVEELIDGVELTVTVLQETALTVTEIVPVAQFYDYHAKYSEGGSTHVIPARVPTAVSQTCKTWAEAIHRLLECRGISRSDFIYDPHRKGDGLFFLEINTQPGMTPTSLVPEQARHCGISFPDLVSRLIACATID